MPVISQITHKIPLPEGTSAGLDGHNLSISGMSGNVSRIFESRRISLCIEDGEIVVSVDLPRRADKALAGTWAAHVRNMVTGASLGFVYRLKIVYSHFPMTIEPPKGDQGGDFVVKNYYGEKVPRSGHIPAGVSVSVKNKDEVVVSGSDVELVGQAAANIERICTVANRDRRVFQDGIYITSKKEVGE